MFGKGAALPHGAQPQTFCFAAEFQLEKANKCSVFRRVFPMGNPAMSKPDLGGRPSHRPSQATRTRVNLLLALGWSNQRIALALDVDLKTLKKHYADELKLRAVAADRLDGMLMQKLLDLFLAGNVGAARELRVLRERNDRRSTVPAEKPLGKKEAALRAAREPDPTTELGRLMIDRAGGEPH